MVYMDLSTTTVRSTTVRGRYMSYLYCIVAIMLLVANSYQVEY